MSISFRAGDHPDDGNDEPKPDHIALLTRDTPLPLARIQDEHLQQSKTISVAWQELQALRAVSRTEKRRMSTPCLIRNRFPHASPTTSLEAWFIPCKRGREFMSYTGAALVKATGFIVHLLARESELSVALECKIIDHANDKTISLFVVRGSLALLVAIMAGPDKRRSCWPMCEMVPPSEASYSALAEAIEQSARSLSNAFLARFGASNSRHCGEVGSREVVQIS